jgi:NitT/TauT family transport system substrate-binding protein
MSVLRCLSLTIIWLVLACQPGAAPPSSASSSNPTAAPTAVASDGVLPQRQMVRVGTQNVLSDALFFIGRDRGHFAAEQLDLDFTVFDSAQQMIAPMGAGQLDIGGGGPGPGLTNAILRGVPVRVVGDRSQAVPGTRANCLAARKELVDAGRLQGFADLRGRVFAENVPGNITTYVFDQELSRAGVSPQELTYTIVPFPDMVTAFANGVVDVALLPEPFITIGQSRGALTCWRPIAEISPGFQLAVLLYSPSFITEHEDVGRRFMVGYVRAIRDYYRAFFGDGSGRSELLPIITESTSVKDPDLLERMAANGIDPDGRVNVDSLRDTQRWYFDRGAIPAEVDMAQMVDLQFVEDATSRLGPYPR